MEFWEKEVILMEFQFEFPHCFCESVSNSLFCLGAAVFVTRHTFMDFLALLFTSSSLYSF